MGTYAAETEMSGSLLLSLKVSVSLETGDNRIAAGLVSHLDLYTPGKLVVKSGQFLDVTQAHIDVWKKVIRDQVNL
jgi:hypothetical protein